MPGAKVFLSFTIKQSSFFLSFRIKLNFLVGGGGNNRKVPRLLSHGGFPLESLTDPTHGRGWGCDWYPVKWVTGRAITRYQM